MNYTVKEKLNQEYKSLNCGSTYTLCNPHSHCKQIHKCPTCKAIHTKKTLDKYFTGINDKKLKKFKYLKYITITPKSLDSDLEIHNSNIDYYNKYLTNTVKRKAKKHPLHNSEYMIFKEITKSKFNKNYLPHLHIILLTDSIPEFNNDLFDFDVRDIEIRVNNKYEKYNDKFNPLTQTLKNISFYSCKVDKDRLEIERKYNISKSKTDTKVSKLFKIKSKKTYILTPIHINMKREILKKCKDARTQALKEHTAYKIVHKRAKGITIHKHALKIQKRLKRIEATKKEELKGFNTKLKAFRLRPEQGKT